MANFQEDANVNESQGFLVNGTSTSGNTTDGIHQGGVVRRRTMTTRESVNGIEDIVMEMPSRTLDRRTIRRNAKVKRSASSYYSTYTRYMRRQNLTHQDGNIITNTKEMVQTILTDIADEHGDVSNEEIKSLPVNMSIKKQIRHHATAHREQQKSRKIGSFQLWKYNMAIRRKQFRQGMKKSLQSPNLWGYHLKQVEGHFGSGVSSYFIFLRGLFFLSIPSFILNFAFISLPQLLDPPPRSNENIAFTGEELLTGANWLTDTVMYYGYYTNETIEAVPGVVYKMPLAYFLATAGYFLLCLLWVTKVTATSFRNNYIEGLVTNTDFISKVLCAWDYGIHSESVANLQHKTITTDLKEELAERSRTCKERSFRNTCQLSLLRLVVWSLYFILTGGCMALVYYINKLLLTEIQKSFEGRKVLQQISLAVIVSIINIIMPVVINNLTMFEQYVNPRHELYIAVFRNYLLKMGMLAVICAFWVNDSRREGNGDDSSAVDCWETYLGQEIYRLVVIDFIFSIIFLSFFAEFLRKIIATHCWKSLEKAEFAIGNNVLDLIYGQTLCWIGVFFSPLLAMVVIIKYFITFYIKKISLMQNCHPPTKRWRASHSRTIFNAFLLISFLLATSFLVYVVFMLTPSMQCGPYRGLVSAYDAVLEELRDLHDSAATMWFAAIFEILFNVWFLYGVVVVLLVTIFMKRSKVKGSETLTKTLRQQIILEGQDKQLLFRWLQDAINQPTTSENQSNNDKHKVPILQHRHDAEASSNHDCETSSLHSQDEILKGDMLTYVDPQHIDASNYGRRMSSASAVLRRKKEHRDPLLYQALAKQKEEQRPSSMFVEGTLERAPPPIPSRKSCSFDFDSDLPSTSTDDHHGKPIA